MPRVTVWECPHTKELFRDEKPYRAHLAQLSRERVAARQYKVLTKDIRMALAKVRNCKSIQDICDYIVKHQREFIINGMLGEYESDRVVTALQKGYKIEIPEIDSLLINTTYSKSISNSHAAPRDGETNWGGDKKNVPRGYPGFGGRIEISFKPGEITISDANKREKRFPSVSVSDMLGGKFGEAQRVPGVHTGSGGGNGNNWRYGLSLFITDFPAIEKIMLFEMLQSPDLTESETIKKLGRGSYKFV